MNVHKVYTIVTNLFGLNFYELEVPLSLILFLNIFVFNAFELVLLYYALVSNNPHWKPVYVLIDVLQLGWPVVMKNFFMIRAIRWRSFDAKFERKTLKIFEASQMRKNKQKFLVYVAVCTLLFAIKTGLGTAVNSVFYNTSHFVTTVVNSTSDFIFIYQILCLKDFLKFIRETKCDVREEILKVFDIKRLIHRRFSINLMLSVSTDFFLIILSLYWLFVRIVFHFLNKYQGEKIDTIQTVADIKSSLDFGSFFYLIQPCFHLLSVFFAYKSFKDEVIACPYY